MSITGKVIKGILTVRYNGIYYPLISSNATAVEGYLHTGDQSYLLALAPEKELARWQKKK